MKTILITGTTSGIGNSLSNLFAKKGYNLVLVSRNYEKLAEQKERLEKKGVNVYIIEKDLTEKNAATEIYQETRSKHIVIDILINNAGFNECGPFHKTNLENELNMLQVHIASLTELTKYYVRDMIDKGDGQVLNVASTGSFAPFPMDAVYTASKAYVLNFSKAVNSELKKTGVGITVLCPGATATEFASKAGIENTLLFKIFVLSPDKVAKVAFTALQKRKKVIVVGAYNKLLVFFMKITPYSIMSHLSPTFFK